jgi:hypothetical protein
MNKIPLPTLFTENSGKYKSFTLEKIGQNVNRCLETPIPPTVFPLVSYQIFDRHHGLFKIIDVGKKNLDAAYSKKSDFSAKKLFPLYLFK